MENNKLKKFDFTAAYTSINKYTDQIWDGFIPSVVGKMRTLDYVMMVPDVKYAKVVPTLNTTFDLVDASNCGTFANAATSSVTGITLTAVPLKFEEALCLEEMEQYYFGQFMKRGSNQRDLPFEQYFIEEKRGKMAKKIDQLFWQGGNGITGVITLATQSGSTTMVGTFSVSTAFTNGVVATLYQMVQNLDSSLRSEDDLVLFVGQDVFDNYAQSVAALNLYHLSADEVSNGAVRLYGKRNVTVVATVGLDGYNKAILTKGSWILFGTDIDPNKEDVQSEYNMYLNKYLLRIRFKLGPGIAYPTLAVVTR